MMKKLIITAITALALVTIPAGKVVAEELTQDSKELKVKLILEKYNSPMLGLEGVLVETAEKYNLDWTILAAISGTESSFAKRMPINCNNPFGWGIYGDNRICFESLENAILEVGEGIGTKYNIASLESIARTYNSANTSKWISNTKYFMEKIKNVEIPVSSLPITF